MQIERALTRAALPEPRSTRSGKEFSPWSSPPIRGAYKFDVQDALIRENNERLARESRHENPDPEIELEAPSSITGAHSSHIAQVQPPHLSATPKLAVSTPKLNKNLKNDKKKRARRRVDRDRQQAATGSLVKAVAQARCAQSTAQRPGPSAEAFDARSDLPVASSGWVGMPQQYAKQGYSLEHLTMELKMTLVQLKEG